MDGWLVDSIKWYAVLAVVSVGVSPFARWLFDRLPDRGASVTRPLGLLTLIWPAWFLAGVSPVPFTAAILWASLLVLGGAGWFVAYRKAWITGDWVKTLVIVEAVSLAAFFAYVGLRGFTPEIVWTEKPMDIAFLTSTAKTGEIPPADPWFAGEPINYYYLGYLIHGTVSRLSGIPTWTGYNLALATTASMAVVGVGGFAFNAVRNRISSRAAVATATLAGFFVVIAGNMHAAVEFVRDPKGVFDQSWWPPGTVGWSSSRIVVDTGSQQAETINEFPWFSLLLGDLHPHLTALPFPILGLSLALNVLFRRQQAGDRHREMVARLAIAGAVVGALYPLNSLDLPTYVVVLIGAIVLTNGWTRWSAIQAGIVVFFAIAFWMPFTARFVPFTGTDSSDLPGWLADLPLLPRLLTTVGWHDGERTSASEFLTVFGLFWIISLFVLGVCMVRLAQLEEITSMATRMAIGLALIGMLAAVALEAPVVILAGVPLVISIWIVTAERRRGALPNAFAPALLAAAYGLILLTEFFYVQDAFSGRYNTLFKVYYQAWVLLAIASAIGIVAVVVVLTSHRFLLAGMAMLLVVGLAAASAYPAIATTQWTRVHGERSWKGLDGAAYLAGYSADDLAAIRWLYDKMEDGDVIVEAPGCSYQINGAVPTGRMAAFTGTPTIIGWGFHEVQWRGGQPELSAEISLRAGDVATIYADPSGTVADAYGATLLYVGSFERLGAGEACEIAGPFPSVNDVEFPGPGWDEVFSSGDARIYRKTDS